MGDPSKGMRAASPSWWDVTVNAKDNYMVLREYCTCPGCKTVWEHKETGNLKADWRWAKEHYQAAYTCGQCGLTTEQIPKPSLWQLFRSIYRRQVEPAPENLPNPFTERQRRGEGRDR